MLIELRIENLAVIERLSIRPEPGLNVLSGETGAGKSIIVGALSLLLGERASTESVRSGEARAVVEGVFDAERVPAARTLLDERGIDADEGLIILRREVPANGRSRAWVNGSASTASFVGEIGRLLVDLHGQHEHQSLLQTAEQREILDEFAGSTELRIAVRAAHADVRGLETRLDEIETGRRAVADRADYLRHQLAEIEGAKLEPGEQAELDADASRLEHAEELTHLADSLHAGLYADEDAIATRLDAMRRQLTQLVRFDAELVESAKTLEDAFYAIEELGRQMGDYASRIEADPAKLERVRRRIDTLFRLTAKYGPTLDDVVETGRRAKEELAKLDDAAFSRKTVEKELERARTEYARLCTELSKRRRKAAKMLDAAMNESLPELGMPDAKFITVLESLAEPGSTGAESVELRVSVNAGFEPGPLARVASGGELSRIMLALKGVLTRHDRVPTLVFDEIDAGIGGIAAHRVADRLVQVGQNHQVFVVTHLAQIASRADHHVLVEKGDTKKLASTSVSVLSGDDRIREIARLLGGDPGSRASLAHALELISAGEATDG
jgi:DNA repair protein RecN (Recombination protein N)